MDSELACMLYNRIANFGQLGGVRLFHDVYFTTWVQIGQALTIKSQIPNQFFLIRVKQNQ